MSQQKINAAFDYVTDFFKAVGMFSGYFEAVSPERICVPGLLSALIERGREVHSLCGMAGDALGEIRTNLEFAYSDIPSHVFNRDITGTIIRQNLEVRYMLGDLFGHFMADRVNCLRTSDDRNDRWEYLRYCDRVLRLNIESPFAWDHFADQDSQSVDELRAANKGYASAELILGFLEDNDPFSHDRYVASFENARWLRSKLLRDLPLMREVMGIGEAGKQAVETVENGDGLPSAALGALIGAGLGSVLNEARKLPAVDRHSRTMMETLAKDASKYDWTLDDWVVHLKASKKTINATPAWDHIQQWREDKKQQRPRAE